MATIDITFRFNCGPLDKIDHEANIASDGNLGVMEVLEEALAVHVGTENVSLANVSAATLKQD